MKIELDLNEEQLKQLDHDLTDVLGNLTEDQKLQIMTDLLYKRLEKVDAGSSNSRRDPQIARWEHFISEIVKGLQKKLAESITEKMLKNEAVLERAEDAINYTTGHLEEIVSKGILEFVIRNTFATHKDMMAATDVAYSALRAAHER